MKAKFIYVFLTCLMIGGQFSLSAQNQVNKDKRQRHTPEQFMERQTNQMVNTLMLDDAAAARFVPVYQNYLKELRYNCNTCTQVAHTEILLTLRK